MKYIENIIINEPLVPWSELCSDGTDSDIELEIQKLYITNQTVPAVILKDIGVVKSLNEVRRNKPELCKPLDHPDCFWLKWGKRRFWIVVGVGGSAE